MVTWFVAVYIVADDAVFGYIFCFGEVFIGQVVTEQAVEVYYKAFVTAHGLYQAFGVVGYVQRVVPGIAFDKAHINGSERDELGFAPAAVGFFGMHKAAGVVEYVLPVLAVFAKAVVYVHAVELFGHLGNAPVIIGVFLC